MRLFDKRPCPMEGCGGTIHLAEFYATAKHSSAEWVCMPSKIDGMPSGTSHTLTQSIETNKGVEHALRSLWILGEFLTD
jgi:hypothetical protein